LPSSVIALVRAQSQLASGALDQAARSLASLSAQEQDTPRAKSIRCDLAQRLGEWREVCALVADVRRSQLYPSTTLDQWEQQAWCELITEGAADEVLSTWKRAPDALKAENSPIWHRLIARLREHPDAEGLYKAISVRLEQYGEPVTLQCVAALPEQYAGKLKKRVSKWVEHDADGDCHAALAHIAECGGDSASAGDLWQIAYQRKPSIPHALRWAAWLRTAGQYERADALEAEALAALRQT
jgi:uncharacterized protein HemY